VIESWKSWYESHFRQRPLPCARTARMVAAPHPREPPHLWKSRKYCAAVCARTRQQAYQSGVAQTPPSVRWFVRVRPLISSPSQGDSGSDKFPRNLLTRPESSCADHGAVRMYYYVPGIVTETDFAHADIFYPSSFTANKLFAELHAHLRLPQLGLRIPLLTAYAR
jgi:hypothetical protein